MEPVEIFFSDLTAEAQQRFIEAGYKPDDQNWESFPLFIFSQIDEEDLDDEDDPFSEDLPY